MLMSSLRDNKTKEQLYSHNNAIEDQSNNGIVIMLNQNHTLKILSLGNNQFLTQGQTRLRSLAKRKNNGWCIKNYTVCILEISAL